MRKALLGTLLLTTTLYGQERNLDLEVQEYLSPVQKVFSVDVRELYGKIRERVRRSEAIPNPHPIILHEPIEELLSGSESPVLIDAVELHMNHLARFRAEQQGIEPLLREYDPSQSLVEAYDFGDVRNVRYTTNARIAGPDGRTTSALCAYFTFNPRGEENELEYRVLVPLTNVARIEEDGVSYVRRTYNKIAGIIQVRTAEGEWKELDNPTLERLQNTPQQAPRHDPRMPDASQRYRN